VLVAETFQHFYVRVVEQDTDLVKRQPGRAVHQHHVQPLDVGAGVSAIPGGGAHARHHQPDVVIVVQRAYRYAGQCGHGADGLGVHGGHYRA